jgi:putative membrane protein
MERFNDAFKSKLYNTIEDIEKNSMVEIVTVIKANSGKYRDVSLWFSVAFMFLCSVFLMFSHFEFNVYVIWMTTFVAFIIGFLCIELIKPFKRLFIGKKRMHKITDIYARAVFQKGGIRFTEKRIGVLFYVSLFEKRVEILPDRGAFTALPGEMWTLFENNFQTVFQFKDVADALIKELQKTKPVFAQYILPIENDINELPDNLEVDI